MPQRRRDRRRSVAALAMLALLLAYGAAAQHTRSTRFTSGGPVALRHDSRGPYVLSGDLTIEAWVRHSPVSRGRKTIVSRGRTLRSDAAESYWFGIEADKLFFSRDGSNFADSTDTVPQGLWTHVAVSVSGANATFYIDGRETGTDTYTTFGLGDEHGMPLMIAGREEEVAGSVGLVDEFHGSLDEIRLWSEARTQSQIASNMLREVRGAESLVAAFGSGGLHDDVTGSEVTLSEDTPQVQEQVNGILPRDLIVPRGPVTGTRQDGTVDPSFEYLGAEQLVIRHRPDTGRGADAVLYLIHNGEDLFIATNSMPWAYGGTPFDESYLGIVIDRDGSHETSVQPDDVQVRGYLSDGAALWLDGDARGGFTPAAPQPDSSTFSLASQVCGDLTPECLEFKIDGAALGTWADTDYLAAFHFDGLGPGHHANAPGDASPTVPATWARVTYDNTDMDWPLSHFSGRVLDGHPDRPVAGETVYLSRGTSLLQQTTTDERGRYSFDVALPEGVTTRLQVLTCSYCRYDDPVVGDTGVVPTFTSQTSAEFPACEDDGGCRFASVDFYMLKPPPAITLGSFEPETGHGRYRRHFGPDDRSAGYVSPTIDADVVTIHGENLHERIGVFFSTDTDGAPSSAGRLSAEITDLDEAGRSWVKVRVPRASDGVDYAIYIEDNWSRPGRERLSRIGMFHYADPPFPEMHGFGFENEPEPAGWNEFRAVYGRNATICIGIRNPFGSGCGGCRVPDPLYALYYRGVFRRWINESNGSCVGMASTALLLHSGEYRIRDFDSEALLTSGIRGKMPTGSGDCNYVMPPTPNNYRTPRCGVVSPRNLWDYIRMNHGVQTSQEFMRPVLAQATVARVDGSYQVTGDPLRALNMIRGNPLQYVLCGSTSLGGSGHCVAPYAIERDSATEQRILSYDNNYPLEALTDGGDKRGIVVNEAANRMVFDRGECRDSDYTGRGLYAVPLDVFTGGHSALGLRDIPEYVFLFTFGDGGVTVESPEGSRFGHAADGTPIRDWTGPVNLSVFGDGNEDGRATPMMIPTGAGDPTVKLTGGDDGAYTLHAGRGSVMLQLTDALIEPGLQDRVRLELDGENVTGMRINSASPRPCVPRVGLDLGERKRLALHLADCVLPAGELCVRTLPGDTGGIALENNSDGLLEYTLVCETVDGEAQHSGRTLFGRLLLPAGASQRLTLTDWPTAEQLHVATDLNGDEVDDVQQTVLGARCDRQGDQPTPDENRDGLPDACEASAPQTPIPLAPDDDSERIATPNGDDDPAGEETGSSDAGLSDAAQEMIDSHEDPNVAPALCPGTMMLTFGLLTVGLVATRPRR